MAGDVRPIRTNADYEAALAEVEKLWGAKGGTPHGDRTKPSIFPWTHPIPSKQ